MPDLHVTRHVIKPHQPHGSEEPDPSQDMLIVVHRNPNDPDDPTEYGHHIRMHGLAYRKEMWGLPDYASTIDMELRDLERYYLRGSKDSIGVHPLAEITEHYFEAPPARMQSFAPGYIMDRVAPTALMPQSTDGAMRMCVDMVLTGIEDVKNCLASSAQKKFPCLGMTALSTDSVATRSRVMKAMERQAGRLRLPSSAPLDAVRQLLTDRESELDRSRNNFVNHALVESGVPEIMRKRVVNTAVKRGILKGNAWT